MCNNVSFGSAYKVWLTPSSVAQNPNAQTSFYDYLDKNKIYHKETTPNYTYKDLKPDTPILKFDVLVDDKKDADIETVCANLGIDFVKNDNSRLIYERIKLSPKGYQKAFVDVEKLEKLVKNQVSNYEHVKEAYDKYQKDMTNLVLKSDENFEVPKLSVIYRHDDGTPESLRDYVRKFGADRLNPNAVGVWQQTDDSSINTFFGLKEMGLKNIPVYMDDESYRNAQTLGLLMK